MEEWKFLICAANQAFDGSYLDNALTLYNRALDLGKKNAANNLNKNPDMSIASVTICYFNIADTYLLMKQPATATQYLRDCFDYLKELERQRDLETEAQLAILRAHRRCYREWLTFRERLSSFNQFEPAIQALENQLTHQANIH